MLARLGSRAFARSQGREAAGQRHRPMLRKAHASKGPCFDRLSMSGMVAASPLFLSHPGFSPGSGFPWAGLLHPSGFAMTKRTNASSLRAAIGRAAIQRSGIPGWPLSPGGGGAGNFGQPLRQQQFRRLIVGHQRAVHVHQLVAQAAQLAPVPAPRCDAPVAARGSNAIRMAATRPHRTHAGTTPVHATRSHGDRRPRHRGW